MNLNKKRVLVTGGGGFIGSHLCEALVHAGARVRALIRYTSRQDVENLAWLNADMRNNIEIIQGDLRDESSLRRTIKDCEVVFHLAALISVPYSFTSPTEFIATNVLGTANLLAASRDEGVSVFVHTSSSEVFGTGQYLPMDESHPLQAQSPYAASKIGADKIAESYHRTYGLPIVVLRPFNTFGPRQSSRAIIPTIIAQSLKGNKVSLGALNPLRDLTFVKDTVRAFVLAAQTPKAIGDAINIGTGVMSSIEDLVRRIGDILGKSLKIYPDTKRLRPAQSEVYRLQCNPEKAKRILGWHSTTPLDVGLMQTIKWMESHKSLFKPHEYHI